MLALARQRAASAGAEIRFVEGRAESISVDAESVDAILASLSLMYVIDPGAAAREIARVLRPAYGPSDKISAPTRNTHQPVSSAARRVMVMGRPTVPDACALW
jgi:ubiquinone/menaquinone biosynthesis C-methylase UbiE